MGIQRRLFESRYTWLYRVLHMDSVAYAIGYEDPKEQYLFYRYKTTNGSTVYASPLNKGPQCGHFDVTKESLKDYTFAFYSTDEVPTVSGLLPRSTSTLAYNFNKHHAIAMAAGYRKGHHIYTDPRGRKWFLNEYSFTEQSESDYPRMVRLMCDKQAEPYGGMGSFVLGAIHEYGGEWFMDDLLGPLVKMDPDEVESMDGKRVIPEHVAKSYTLEETDSIHDAAIVVRFPVPRSVRGFPPAELKYYKLTLHLNIVQKNQCFDIAPVLESMWNSEFQNMDAVIREHNIQFELDGDLILWSSGMKAKFGNRYYNTLPTAKPFWNGRVEIRSASLPRSFA